MEKVITSFEKKGKNINVVVNVNLNNKRIYLENEGNTVYVCNILEHKKHGYYYQVSTKEAEKLFGEKIGKEKYIGITSDTAKFAKEEAEKVFQEYRNKIINEAFNKLTDGSKMKLLKGTSYTFIYPEIENANEHSYFEKSINLIHKLTEKEVEEVLGRGYDDLDWGDYSSTLTYKITFAEYKKLAKLAEEKETKKQKRKQEKREQAEKEREEIFRKARETGEKQILSKWSEPCNDPNEECSLDFIVQYAMPNGKVETVRSHTW